MKRLPPIPGNVPSILGPVPVEIVQGLRTHDDRQALGIWRQNERDVRVEADAARIVQWQTYWHEWMHIVLTDAGVELTEDAAERVCDAVGNARTREMLDA